MSGPAAGLAGAILLRQAGITALRRTGRASWLHAHDSISLAPLLATLVFCLYALRSDRGDSSDALGRVSMTSPLHVAVCLGPQTLAWFTCLRNRHELSRADFAYHVAGVGLCLLLAVWFGSPLLAVGVSLCGTGLALLRRNSLAVLFWLVLALLVSQLAWAGWASEWEAWVTMGGEAVMMFAVKFRLPWLSAPPTTRHKDSTADSATDSTVDVEQAETDDVVFDLVASPPLVPFQDGATPSPPLVPASLPGLFPTFHHRRDVSIQSNSSWSWGPAVADFSARHSRSSHSSDEDEDEEEEEEVDVETGPRRQPPLKATTYYV